MNWLFKLFGFTPNNDDLQLRSGMPSLWNDLAAYEASKKQFNEHMSERLHTLNSKLDSITSRTKPTAWAYDLLIMGNIVPWVSIDKPTGNYGNLRPLYEPDRTPPDPTKDEWVRKSARNNQLLYAFMLDCNAVGVQTAAENLVRSLKQNAKETL